MIALNPRNTGERLPKSPYQQRWHVESAFSQHKRRFGSPLTARRAAVQQRELVLRVLTHNLTLLAHVA